LKEVVDKTAKTLTQMEVYIGTYESANNTGCYLHLQFLSVFAHKRPSRLFYTYPTKKPSFKPINE